ncbi:MAG: peptide deformylase [Candidatus Eisenbacteria sp.]|nr:peptide deformylase [Candidatus Eisenbacteria bacterium]
MAERAIITYGNPILAQRAALVVTLDAPILTLVDDLFATMASARGLGLAAPQVAELTRVIVIDPTVVGEAGARALALINPEVLEYAGAEMFEEGCLSVPGIYAEIRRPERVLVRYRDVEDREHEEEFAGLMARVIQHEIDHLDGTLFIDRLSRMRRALLIKKLRQSGSAGDDSHAAML